MDCQMGRISGLGLRIEACEKDGRVISVGVVPTSTSVIFIAFLACLLKSLRRSASVVVKELSMSNARMSRSLGMALDLTSEYRFLAPVLL